MQNRRFASAVLLALALASCADGTAPDVLTGSYALATIRGVPAPLVLWEATLENGNRQRQVMDHDSLRFTSDSTLQRSWHRSWHELYPDGTPVHAPTWEGRSFPSFYEREGNRIVVRADRRYAFFAPDTFYVRGQTLVRTEWTHEPCAGCPPPVVAEFVYEPG